jgi:ketosteroid isomerase-like protein
MTEERGGSSVLKGRLADVYVRALVDGSLEALSRRLGNRATIDDPLFGRASTLSSIDPLLEKAAARFKEAQASYRHVASTTGVDRDVCEGVLTMTTSSGKSEVPIAVVAERRRLREIELRIYYAAGSGPRRAPPPARTGDEVPVPQIVAHVLDALRKGAVERVLAAFEEASRWVDSHGRVHAKRDGAMASFISGLGGGIDFVPTGAADDGRTCCIEVLATRRRQQDPEPATLSFERGDSGLIRELRLYYEP